MPLGSAAGRILSLALNHLDDRTSKAPSYVGCKDTCARPLEVLASREREESTGASVTMVNTGLLLVIVDTSNLPPSPAEEVRRSLASTFL